MFAFISLTEPIDWFQFFLQPRTTVCSRLLDIFQPRSRYVTRTQMSKTWNYGNHTINNISPANRFLSLHSKRYVMVFEALYFFSRQNSVRKRYSVTHCRRLHFAPFVQQNIKINLPTPFWAGTCPFPLQKSEVGGFASVSWFSSTPVIPAILKLTGLGNTCGRRLSWRSTFQIENVHRG